ncbi:MAG: Gp15 family bacteriophage protein [Coriobacteriia bacterium]
MNILASPLPATVEIDGASVPIRAGYRTGIQVARIVESDLSGDLILSAILAVYFPGIAFNQPEDVFDAALLFFRCGQEQQKKSRRAARVLDWDHDAGMILADFRREYDIDLADPATRIHWWVFMAYFENLSADSETKTAMYYRGASRPKDLKGEAATRFNTLKRYYALPPRTTGEALAREAAMWGDT